MGGQTGIKDDVEWLKKAFSVPCSGGIVAQIYTTGEL
jgi:hypothetical protein